MKTKTAVTALFALGLVSVAFGQSPPPLNVDIANGVKPPQVEPLGEYRARMEEQQARIYALRHQGWTPEERREERERFAALAAQKQAAKDAKKAAKEAAKAAKLAAKERRKAA